jgi:adenylate cyclase class IV
MLEFELKSLVDDAPVRRALVERAGGRRVFEGSLQDRRYDTPEESLAARDHVLRVRTYRTPDHAVTELDWKGPSRRDNGYKLREELGAHVVEHDALVAILDRLGYVVTNAIDREIAQYELDGATIRFERYPRMDDLVEVEGEPAQIERAIAVLGIPRERFTADALSEFVRRFEARTGEFAVVSSDELAGKFRPRSGDG